MECPSQMTTELDLDLADEATLVHETEAIMLDASSVLVDALSMGQALLRFLESLPEPIIPFALYAHALEADNQDAAYSVSLYALDLGFGWAPHFLLNRSLLPCRLWCVVGCLIGIRFPSADDFTRITECNVLHAVPVLRQDSSFPSRV